MIAPKCGNIIPDFLVHKPGHMGHDDNLVIVEVKTIQGANFNNDGEDLLKDTQTIKCMTELENGYYRGIILIFGAGHEEKKSGIAKVYKQICNPEKVLLLFHNEPKHKAEVVTI